MPALGHDRANVAHHAIDIGAGIYRKDAAFNRNHLLQRIAAAGFELQEQFGAVGEEVRFRFSGKVSA